MQDRIREQIEQILDEGVGLSRKVIVQVEDTTAFAKVISASSSAIRSRSLATSARELMPPLAQDLRSKRRSAAMKARLKEQSKSLTSQLAMQGGFETKSLKSSARSGLKALLGSVDLKDAVARQHSRSRRKKMTPVRALWSSSSVVLDIGKDDLIPALSGIGNIAGVYPNRTVKVPPVVKVSPNRLPQNVAESKVAAWGVNAVGAMSVWGAYGTEGQGVRVAVLDTGVDAEHPDLVDKVNGWAEFDADGNPVPGSVAHDSGQHGTHVAATIAGGDASGQFIGVAPQAEILGGLVLKGGSGTDAQILAGIEWAIDQNVDVINMSLGGLRFSPEVFDTYTQAFLNANLNGISVVVSVGNEGSQISGPPGNDYFSFAVGATDGEDRAAGFSGGRTLVISNSRFIDEQYLPLVYSKPDVSAPGVAITSAVPGSGYETWNGTSMAAPHVSGAIAVLLSATTIKSVDPGDRAFLIQDLLTATVEELGEAGQDHRYGFGRIDVLRAVGYARELGYA